MSVFLEFACEFCRAWLEENVSFIQFACARCPATRFPCENDFHLCVTSINSVDFLIKKNTKGRSCHCLVAIMYLSSLETKQTSLDIRKMRTGRCKYTPHQHTSIHTMSGVRQLSLTVNFGTITYSKLVFSEKAKSATHTCRKFLTYTKYDRISSNQHGQSLPNLNWLYIELFLTSICNPQCPLLP